MHLNLFRLFKCQSQITRTKYFRACSNKIVPDQTAHRSSLIWDYLFAFVLARGPQPHFEGEKASRSVLVVQSEQHVIYRLMAGGGQGGPS